MAGKLLVMSVFRDVRLFVGQFEPARTDTDLDYYQLVGFNPFIASCPEALLDPTINQMITKINFFASSVLRSIKYDSRYPRIKRDLGRIKKKAQQRLTGYAKVSDAFKCNVRYLSDVEEVKMQSKRNKLLQDIDTFEKN